MVCRLHQSLAPANPVERPCVHLTLRLLVSVLQQTPCATHLDATHLATKMMTGLGSRLSCSALSLSLYRHAISRPRLAFACARRCYAADAHPSISDTLQRRCLTLSMCWSLPLGSFHPTLLTESNNVPQSVLANIHRCDTKHL